MLEELLIDAVAAYEALPPEEKAKHRAAQRKLWVLGELMLSNPAVSKEEAEAVYEKVITDSH